MGKIVANIRYIKDLDFSRFDIPFYQRPYRWQISHVDTLLNSLKANMSKKEYRIGSIIVNPDSKGMLDIVDGQQRLTTITLLFICLDGPDTIYKLNCRYRHLDSRHNIYRNYHHIKEWLELHKIDRDSLREFVLNRCSVVIIEAEELSEAFQMFDSQNGRGKELEAYNLLKAYHLRAIDNDKTIITITDEKKEIDRQWEASVAQRAIGSDVSLLKYIINELYRIRQWSKRKKGKPFSKSRIKEFKGVQFNNQSSSLPLYNYSFLLYIYYSSAKGVASRSGHHINDQNPYVSINMDIINGKLFFSYVETYISSYNYLFVQDIAPDSPLCQFRHDFHEYCLNYAGSHRTGDRFIREVYMALVLAIYDRFGEQYVARYYKTLYNIAYRKRLEQYSVFYATIAEYPIDFFENIAHALHESDLDFLHKITYRQIYCKKLGDKEKKIARYIFDMGTTLIKDNQIIDENYFLG